MYAETFKLIAAVIVALLLMLAGKQVLDWREQAQQGKARGNVITSTAGINKDATAADAQRVTIDVDVSDARAKFKTEIKRGERNEPATADRANRPVPVSVRNAFRDRRLTRERSGCVGVECEQRPPAPTPAQR